MDRTFTSHVPEEDGKEVIVAGWARELRTMGTLSFIILADREGTIQIAAKEGNVPQEVLDVIPTIERESVIWVKGKVSVQKQARGGREIVPQEIKVLSHAKEPLPLIVREQENPEEKTRFDNRFMDLRREKSHAIFAIRSEACRAMREFLRSKGFVEVHTPKITITGTESGAEVFEMDYYGRDAFIVQSAQLYKQMLQSAGFDRVFEITPQWRAEKSNTSRHLAESWSTDVELSFIKDEEDVMNVIEEMVTHTIREIVLNCKKHLDLLGIEVQVPKTPFRRLTYAQCVDVCKNAGQTTPENDLDTDNLNEIVKDNPMELFFITKWPMMGKPFYIMADDDPEISRSFDLQFGALEVSSGGQRIHNADLLEEMIDKKGMKKETLQFYLDAFRYGMPPHGGFGFGIDRFISKLLGIGNVREAVLFPRTPDRVTP